MSWLGTVRALLPAPDNRTAAQIESELDEELSFHIGQIERELLEAGFDPESARGQALTRFGDPAAIRDRCRRIAMGDRLMLQRINLILMLVVLAAVALLSVQLFVLQRQNAALREIAQQLALASPRTAAPTGSMAPGLPSRPAHGPGSAETELREELPGRWQPAGDGQAPDSGAVLEIRACSTCPASGCSCAWRSPGELQTTSTCW